MEVAGALFEAVHHLKDDELKHGAGESQIGTEYKLHRTMTELVVAKQLLNEEDPADNKEDDLAGHHHHAVPKQAHFDGKSINNRTY